MVHIMYSKVFSHSPQYANFANAFAYNKWIYIDGIAPVSWNIYRVHIFSLSLSPSLSR